MAALMKIFAGVVPAFLLTLTGLAYFRLVTTTYEKMLVASALAGTCGLVWSLIGYSRRTAPVVLALLVSGMVGVLFGGIGDGLSALLIDAHNGNLGSSTALGGQWLIMSWFTLGPAIVGLLQARQAVRVLRAVA